MAKYPEGTILPESCEEHHGNAWKDYTLAELGQWVHLLVKRATHRKDMGKRRKDLTDAQNYLNMMQAHIDAAVVTQPNELLAELPMEETSEPTLVYTSAGAKPELETREASLDTLAASLAAAGAAPTPVEPTMVVKDGNIVAISAQIGERGYDPNAHEKELRIFCDGRHIETAHTADVQAGVVKFYVKSPEGRIRTEEVRGKVEIRAEIPIEE